MPVAEVAVTEGAVSLSGVDLAGIGLAGAHLAGPLVRRLAHDLAGPLAAATLLAEEAGDSLLKHSITRTCDLLALYRAVFGGHPDEPVDTAALWQRLAGAIAPATIAADIAPAAPARRHKAVAALVLAAAGCQAVRVQLAADGAFSLQVSPPRPLSRHTDGLNQQPADPAMAFAWQVAGPLHCHTIGGHTAYTAGPLVLGALRPPDVMPGAAPAPGGG